MEKKIPKHIAKAVANWLPMAVGLRALFIVLVLVSIVGSLVVSTFADQLSPLWIRICSFSAALSIVTMTSMDIAGKANRVRRAIRLFTVARARFESEDNYTIENLITAYEAAEELMGDVNYIPQDTRDSTTKKP